MPATFSWGQSWGATGSPNHVDLGTMGNLMNWKANDDGTPANYTTYPIQAGSNSYEVSLRLHFTGPFNKVQNCKFWKSSGSLGAGCTLLWASGGYQTYVQGGTPTSSKAVDALAVAQPSAANVSIGGSLSGSLVGAGYTDYVITQLKTTAAASPGDTGTVNRVAPHSGDVMSGDGHLLETPCILDYSLSARRVVKMFRCGQSAGKSQAPAWGLLNDHAPSILAFPMPRRRYGLAPMATWGRLCA